MNISSKKVFVAIEYKKMKNRVRMACLVSTMMLQCDRIFFVRANLYGQRVF